MFVADEAHVTNIAVHPDQRRTGIATRLLGALADDAIERGCAAWTLEVRARHRRPGAVPRVRVRPGRRAQGRTTRTTEDAIVMWCHDIQTDEYAERLAGCSCDAVSDRRARWR